MTPTTATDDSDRRWTLEDAERARERRRELLESLDDLREEKRELDERIAQAVAGENGDGAGEDLEQLRERRAEVEQFISDFESGEKLLEEAAEERERAALRFDAEDRLQEIVKVIGGLRGEQPRKLERAVEALESARDQLRKAGQARAKTRVLKEEARILSGAFGLGLPDLETLPNPIGTEELKPWAGWSVKKALATSERQASGASSAASRGDTPKGSMRALEGVDVPLDSPTRDLLDRLEEVREGEPG